MISEVKFFLDEGVPVSVGKLLESEGFDVIFFKEAATPGMPDPVICDIALANGAVLVALDGDMKKIAQRRGIGNKKYRSLNLLKLSCNPVVAKERLAESIDYIRLALSQGKGKKGRKFQVEIKDTLISIHKTK